MDNSINYTRLIEHDYSCPVCNSKKIIEDIRRAEIYCSNCGLVICDPENDHNDESYDYSEGTK